jgi:lysophospholipase L1-like esterase
VSNLDNLSLSGAENSPVRTSPIAGKSELLDLSSPQSFRAVRDLQVGQISGPSPGVNNDFILVAYAPSDQRWPSPKPVSFAAREAVSDATHSVPTLKLPHLDASQLKKLGLEAHGPALSDWDSKHKALVTKAAKTDAKLQFFGDSITEYMGNGNMDAFDKNFASLKPANFGIAGDSTDGLFRRVNDGELGGHPKVASLMIGTNDIPTSKSADEIAQSIAKIVETVRLKEPETKVLIMGLLPRCSPTDPNREKFHEKISQVNAEISQLSNGNTIRYLDLGAKFEDAKGQARQDLLGDYLHPSHAGYEVWSDAVKPVIDSMSK